VFDAICEVVRDVIDVNDLDSVLVAPKWPAPWAYDGPSQSGTYGSPSPVPRVALTSVVPAQAS